MRLPSDICLRQATSKALETDAVQSLLNRVEVAIVRQDKLGMILNETAPEVKMIHSAQCKCRIRTLAFWSRTPRSPVLKSSRLLNDEGAGFENSPDLLFHFRGFLDHIHFDAGLAIAKPLPCPHHRQPWAPWRPQEQGQAPPRILHT
jgi:hypothetical protein